MIARCTKCGRLIGDISPMVFGSPDYNPSRICSDCKHRELYRLLTEVQANNRQVLHSAGIGLTVPNQ